MTLYNVHIFREMRLLFANIAAATPEEAAKIAADLPTTGAKTVEDCDGTNVAAVVDVVGDKGFAHSKIVKL